jgi:hypothetical protein
MVAHVQTWLPKHLQGAFIEYMCMLEGILSPAVNDEKIVRKNYKKAKSALRRFPAAASSILKNIIEDVVKIEQDKIKARKAAAEKAKV